MKTIYDFLVEKLIIDKTIKSEKYIDFDYYWFGDIDNQGDMIDAYYENRKLKHKTNKNGELKNRPWFAVYLYIKKNGPSKRADITKALWGEVKNNLGRFFSNMVHCHMIYSNNGKTTLIPDKEWSRYRSFQFKELMGIKGL